MIVKTKKHELGLALDIVTLMAARVRLLPVVFALHGDLCEQPFFDKSCFPAWAKKIID